MTASNGAPQSGIVNAQGQFVPLSNASGVIQTPGQTTILGGLNSAGSSLGLGNIGSTISQSLSSLTPFIPYLVIGVVILFVFKLIKK